MNEKTSEVIAGKAKPRGSFPHYRRAGDFIFVSGTSSRLPDNSFAGARVDELGTVELCIKTQTRAVIENMPQLCAADGDRCVELSWKHETPLDPRHPTGRKPALSSLYM